VTVRHIDLTHLWVRVSEQGLTPDITFSRSSSTFSANLTLMCFTTNFLACSTVPCMIDSQQCNSNVTAM
jgi:hypothetical protein